MPENDYILGVDICRGSLRAAELQRDSEGYVLRRCCQVPLCNATDAAAAAGVLRELLSQNDFTAKRAVFSLGGESCFLRYGDETLLDEVEEDSVCDSWKCSNGSYVVAMARKNASHRIGVIAARAGLSLEGIDMRSMACMQAAGMLGIYAGKVTLAFTVDDNFVTMGVFEGQAVRLLQSREPNSYSHDDILKTIGQMYRLVRLANADIRPTRVRILWDGCDKNEVASLKELFELDDVELVAHQWRPADGQSDLFDLGGRYIAAVGLAMEPLAAPGPKHQPELPRPFDFSLKPARRKKIFRLTRKRIITACGVILLLILAALIIEVATRQIKLSRLRSQYEELEPVISRYQERSKLWQSVRPWVAADKQGRRPAYRPVLDAVSDLLPTTDQAYIMRMEMKIDPETQAQTVRLEGRSSGTEVLYEFVSRLNESQLFDKAKLGTVTNIPDSTSVYGKKWSVTFSILPEGVKKETARQDKENSTVDAEKKKTLQTEKK